MTKKNTGLKRIVCAGLYSLKGLKAAWQHEAAFRQELILFIIMLPLAVILGSNGIERALLVGSLLLVLIIELVNSAIEAAIDRIGSEHHELSGRAKDIASAAVLLSLIQVPIIWLLVLMD